MAKNTEIIILNNEQDSIPRATSVSGTLTSVNNGEQITGSGTSFTDDVNIGEWLYDKDNNQFAKVRTIISDTELYVHESFDTAVSGQAYFVTPNTRVREISWDVTGASNATVDGVTYEQGEGDTIRVHKSDWNDPRIEPIDFDATGTEIKITVYYG